LSTWFFTTLHLHLHAHVDVENFPLHLYCPLQDQQSMIWIYLEKWDFQIMKVKLRSLLVWNRLKRVAEFDVRRIWAFPKDLQVSKVPLSWAFHSRAMPHIAAHCCQSRATTRRCCLRLPPTLPYFLFSQPRDVFPLGGLATRRPKARARAALPNPARSFLIPNFHSSLPIASFWCGRPKHPNTHHKEPTHTGRNIN
jgi:hypothetical protein